MANPIRPLPMPESLPEDFLRRSPQLFEEAIGAKQAHTEYFGLLLTLARLAQDNLQRVLRRFGLSQSDYQILSILRVQGKGLEIAPRQLNELIGLTSAGMTAALDRLVAADHLERIPNPADRRSILVRLTDEGWETAETVCRAVCDQQSRVLEAATDGQIARNNAQLRQMVSRFAP